MFFSKKSHESSDNVAKKGIKTMDAVVTGVVLGGIVASIYGVKKLRETKTEEEAHNMVEPPKQIERKWFWKRIFSSK